MRDQDKAADPLREARRAIVFGGAGYIGSHVVRELVGRGCVVRVFDLPDVPIEHLPRECVEFVRGDVRDVSAVRGAVEGWPVVIHLAGHSRMWARDRSAFEAVDHRGAVNVLEAAAASGAKRIVYVSTESILAGPRGTVIDERAELRELDMIGPYCLSKCRAELFAQHEAASGRPVVIVTPTVPVGPGDHRRGPLTRLIAACAAGRIKAYVDAQVNLIDVRDAAAGIVAAAARDRPGRRYLLAAETWTVHDILQTVLEATGRRQRLRRVPYAAALLFAMIEERLCAFCPGREPLATVTGVRLTRRSFDFDGTASARELGMTWRPCRPAIEATVRWLSSLSQAR